MLPDPAGRLDSWKEIAAYLRRGARTVQRWEREESLPVHRLHHDKLASVYAYAAELDAWWETRRSSNSPASPAISQDSPSVAVLPFADLTKDKDHGYLCEGIAEEIISALSRIRKLHVASRLASFRFRPGAAETAEAGRRLKVKNLLEGSIRKSNSHLRISVRLTDAATAFQVWTETYSSDESEIFTIQEEIARSVVNALELELTAKERADLCRPATTNPQAYDCYLRGRKYFYGFGPRDMDFAIQLFLRATSLDPAFAAAWAGLADCWSYLYLYSSRTDAVREQAEWASEQAVQTDPASAQAHVSRALALSLSNNVRADTEFEIAGTLDPGLFEAHYFYARYLFSVGDIAKAVREYEAAIRCRPEDYQAPLLVAQSYELFGRVEDAKASRMRGIQAAQRHLELNPDDARALYMAANGLVALGRTDEGIEYAKRSLEMRPDDGMLLFNIGCIYSMAGRLDDAMSCLEKAFQLGLTQRGWYEHDSNLDALRQHPRFQQLLRQLP